MGFIRNFIILYLIRIISAHYILLILIKMIHFSHVSKDKLSLRKVTPFTHKNLKMSLTSNLNFHYEDKCHCYHLLIHV